MAHSLMVCTIDIHQLAAIVRNRIDNALILDSRSFLEYNASHVINAVNVGCAKLMKRRLQQEKLCIEDFLAQNCHCDVDRSIDIIVYDQNTQDVKFLPPDSFMTVFLQKLLPVYNSVSVLKGGFLEFQSAYPNLCEDERTKYAPLTSLSQPCLPVSNHGPTRILPFLYLGSQHDALNKEALQHHNITYQLNVSTSCPKPDFIQESHFMRIPVIDNYSEKLLPHFSKAFQFLDKVRESGGCVLVHCLAGISRSATVAIAYVMRAMKMTSDEAYRYVKAKRATISPNFNFLGQLLEYEKQLQKEYALEYKSDSPAVPLYASDSHEIVKGNNCILYQKTIESYRSIENIIPDDYSLKFSDISEIKSSKVISTNFTSEVKESFASRECATKKLDTYSCIPEKQYSTLNIKCLPVSSLKELNFTPCQTSLAKPHQCLKADKSISNQVPRPFNSPTSPNKLYNINYSNSMKTDKKTENLYTEIRLAECKVDSVRNVNQISPFLPSPADHKAFDFDSKSYNRSDSVSTSGLGSEGSDYADSWNDYNSSYERESDILMDDDYPSVPAEEDKLHRSKMLGFDDSYDDSLSLYSKYENTYENCHTQRHLVDCSQTVPDKNAKEYNTKYEETKYSDIHTVRNAEAPLRSVLNLPSGLYPSLLNNSDLGRAHLLYRAQSCPGMLSSESGGSDSENVPSASSVKLRQTRSASSSKDKFKNRYSCSSIDYMDYSVSTSMSPVSCPNALHLSGGSENTKMSSSHCNYRHSMIQVS